MLGSMIKFNSLVHQDTNENHLYGARGGPWEFNLRDVFRWCEVMLQEQGPHGRQGQAPGWEPGRLLDTLYLQRMRTAADREKVLGRFLSVFPEPSTRAEEGQEEVVSEARTWGQVSAHPELRVTPLWVQIGEVLVSRGTWTPGVGAGFEAGDTTTRTMPFPIGLRRPLQALGRCVNMGWPTLIMGSRGSGKTSLVRGLALAVGAGLREVAITPSIDVTELLGCHEQVDARSEHHELLRRIQSLTVQLCRAMLERIGTDQDKVKAGSTKPPPSSSRSVWDAYQGVRRCYDSPLLDSGLAMSSSVSGFDLQGISAVGRLIYVFNEALEEISTHAMAPKKYNRMCRNAGASAVERHAESNNREVEKGVGVLEKEMRRELDKIKTLSKSIERALEGASQGSVQENRGAFRWSDGVLVQAVERGDWLFLDGANLCSSSVLDRLNPLLEPGGVLLLTECGGEGDTNNLEGGAGARTINPHPNFRLFLGADPTCGEVSRAMRNRCVEICLEEHACLLVEAPKKAKPSEESTVDGMEADRCGLVTGVSRSTRVHHILLDLLAVTCTARLINPVGLVAAVAAHGSVVRRRKELRGKGGSSEITPRALSRWAEMAVAWGYRSGLSKGVCEALLRTLPLAYPEIMGSRKADMYVVERELRAVSGKSDGDGVDGWDSASFFASKALLTMLEPGWGIAIDESATVQKKRDVRLLSVLNLLCKACRAVCEEALDEGADGRAGEESPGVAAAVFMFAAIVSDEFRGNAFEGWVGSAIGDPQLGGAPASPSRTKRGEGVLVRPWETNEANLGAGKGRGSSADCCGTWLRNFSALLPHASAEVTRRMTKRAVLDGGDALELESVAIPAMFEAVVSSTGWTNAWELLKKEMDGEGVEQGILGPAAALESDWERVDPRDNAGFCYYLCGKVVGFRGGRGDLWTCFKGLLDFHAITVTRRLVVISREKEELVRSREKMESFKVSRKAISEGMGWLGLSCLASEGGYDLGKIGFTSGNREGGGFSVEARLARKSVAPYLLPLLCAADRLVRSLACVDVWKQGVGYATDEWITDLLHAVDAFSQSRDDISRVFLPPRNMGGLCSCTLSQTAEFPWDIFLVCWKAFSWAADALLVRVDSVVASKQGNLWSTRVMKAGETLGAVRSRVDSAVLEHCGGVSPQADTLWHRGGKAAVPWTPEGAEAIHQLALVGESFKVRSEACTGTKNTSGSIGLADDCGQRSEQLTLANLFTAAHPALFATLETRQEVLHGLGTLYWAATSEIGGADGVSSRSTSATRLLCETVPKAVKEGLSSKKKIFLEAYRGTRLGSADDATSDSGMVKEEDGAFDEGFNSFESGVASAVARASLVVFSAGEGQQVELNGTWNSQNVLETWGDFQLAPLREHWIVVEECALIADIAMLVAKVSRELPRGKRNGLPEVENLMIRVKRLLSVIMESRSLSPVAARPYQTLVWAWDSAFSASRDPLGEEIPGTVLDMRVESGSVNLVSLLKCLLPVALDSWGNRLWCNLYQTPGALSVDLGPPALCEMEVYNSTETGGGDSSYWTEIEELGEGFSGKGAMSQGVPRLFHCVRTAFLLQLCAVSGFGGESRGVGAGQLSRAVWGEGAGTPGRPGGGGLLTLMNASVRRSQFVHAMHLVRSMPYPQEGNPVNSLLVVSGTSLAEVLRVFNAQAGESREESGLSSAPCSNEPLVDSCVSSERTRGHDPTGPFTKAVEMVYSLCDEGGVSKRRLADKKDKVKDRWYKEFDKEVRSGMVICGDDRLRGQVDMLLLPAVRALRHAVQERENADSRRAAVGLGLALVGTLRLQLLLPSTPVDPGVRPALQRRSLQARLLEERRELTIRKWALRMDGAEDCSEELRTLLATAFREEKQCAELEAAAVQRPEDSPIFSSLFRELHSYGGGVGSPKRVASIAESLASAVPDLPSIDLLGISHTSRRDTVPRAVQEEQTWQSASAAFVDRLREKFWHYRDLTVGICEATEMTRMGLRLLASCVADESRGDALPRKGGTGVPACSRPVEVLGAIQEELLVYPYTSKSLFCGSYSGSTTTENLDHLAEGLWCSLDPHVVNCMETAEGMVGATTKAQRRCADSTSRVRYAALLQAVLSRSELYLSSGCSGSETLAVASKAINIAVSSWARIEAEEVEKRRKEEEILKYKVQEHNAVNDNEKEEARLQALFPDFSLDYGDIFTDEKSDRAMDSGPEKDGTKETIGLPDGVNYLGNLSDRQVSLLVASHARIFYGGVCRARLLEKWRLRGLVEASSGRRPPPDDPGDALRLHAFQDSYRASALLAMETGKLPVEARLGVDKANSSCQSKGEGDVQGDGPGLMTNHREDLFAPSHLLALADASLLCGKGLSLLETAVFRSISPGDHTASGDKGGRREKKSGKIGTSSLESGVTVGVPQFLSGQSPIGRSFCFVDPVLDFHHSPNAREARLADAPLAGLLSRIAELLEEFPGNGILIQLARAADRIRRMSLHSPVGAVLTGVELTLSKAQEWEQLSHRGVSLSERLRPLSALVMRWRRLELNSWPLLLDARESSYVSKARRWWLHLHRLLLRTQEDPDIGSLSKDDRNPLINAASESEPFNVSQTFRRGTKSNRIAWPSANRLFLGRNWLWGSVDPAKRLGNMEPDGFDEGDVLARRLDESRGLFDALDTFVRTSPIGEFTPRLELLHAFAAHLSVCIREDIGHIAEHTPTETSASRDTVQETPHRKNETGDPVLSNLVLCMWQYYSQFVDDVQSARDSVRRGIEKKLKEEVKLARWDEQSYYSLAESSVKSHRKLTKLLGQYEEILEVSVSEVLHRAITAGVGERGQCMRSGAAPTAVPSTDVPSLLLSYDLLESQQQGQCHPFEGVGHPGRHDC
ncbi:unnamed protein product [Discosporangium mesarthrocarpum]